MNSTYQLYEPRRTEHALCCDFPADKVLICGLHTLEKYWWNKGWQSSLSAVRVMNAVHYVATYMFNMPTRTQAEYDQMLYDYVGQDRMLMQAAMLALPEMLRRIALPQARTYRALMMEDRPEEFYEGVSLYQQWLEGAEVYYREEDFLIDVMDEVNILRMQNNNLLNKITKMENETRHIGYNVEHMTINMSGGTLVQHADVVQANGEVKVEKTEAVRQTAAYEPEIPPEGKYNKVREYIEERKKYDEEFKSYCDTHTRKDLCERLTDEFGWTVDRYALGRNINRH